MFGQEPDRLGGRCFREFLLQIDLGCGVLPADHVIDFGVEVAHFKGPQEGGEARLVVGVEDPMLLGEIQSPATK